MLRPLLSESYLVLIIAIALLFFMQSCDAPRYVYSAPTQNIPHLTKKGDFTVAGFVAAGTGSSSAPRIDRGYTRGSDFQGAYALSDRVGIIVNRFSRSENRISSSVRDSLLTIHYNRGLTEYGAGYLFPKKHSASSTYFQIFAGAATGKFKINENGFSNSLGYTRFHTSDITKIFIQPAVILAPGNFTAGFSSRFCSVKYHNISTDYDRLELEDYFLHNLSPSAVFFWEPAIDLSFDLLKHKGLKLEVQMDLVILLNKKFVDYRTANFGFGIKVDNNLFKKRAITSKSDDAVSVNY